MKHEPEAFSWKHDRERSTEVYEQWAERVWGEESANCPEMAAERDYYLGFRDGFVDFIWAGGNGEPPPVPPRHLWNVMLRSPDGKRRADLWFDGYRHGARVARFGGYREMGTIRTSLVGLARDPNGMEYPVERDWPSHSRPPSNQFHKIKSCRSHRPPQASSVAQHSGKRSGRRRCFHMCRSRNQCRRDADRRAQIARPVNKQPAAFEALGLALLPTDQPMTKSASTLEMHDGSRPVLRGIKPTNPPPARYRRNPGKPTPPRLLNRQKRTLRLPVTSIPSTRNAREMFPTARIRQPADSRYRARPISRLRKSRCCGTLRADCDAKRKRPATLAGGTADLSSNSTSQSVGDPAREPAVRPSLIRRRPGNRSNTHGANRTNSRRADTPVKVKAAGRTPSHPPNSPVKFLNTITEPAGETSAKEHRATDASSPPKITISAGDDGQVERIVISGPSPANTPASAAAQSNTIQRHNQDSYDDRRSRTAADE